MYNLASILPCPFCGKQPHVHTTPESRITKPGDLWIECKEPHCPNPAVHSTINGDKDSFEAMVSIWNQRN